MKEKNVFIAIVVLAGLIWMGAEVTEDRAFADSTARQVKNDLKLAMFMVPDLSVNVAKDISKALASEPGVLSAKADFDRREFSVTYEPGQISLKKLQGIIEAICREARLEKVEPAQETSGRPGCWKCPSRNRCGKQN